MLQINSESVQIMLMQIMERFDRIDRTLERMNKLKECLEGDTLLDNYHQTHAGTLPPEEVCHLLHD